MKSRPSFLALALVALASCAAGKEPSPPRAPRPTVQTSAAIAPTDPKLLEDLALLATGSPRGASVRLGDSLERTIDALLDDPQFGADVAPAILLPEPVRSTNADYIGYALKSFAGAAGPVYYLRKPCSESAAETVLPWWKYDQAVRVCPDSHRPQVVGDGSGHRCGSVMLDPANDKTNICGCGPNLIYCARDEEHRRQMASSARDEVLWTVGDAARRDLPIEQIFLANETVRDRNAEFLYRRWRIAAGGDPAQILGDLGAWPDVGRLARREESRAGQHAGILTTESLAFINDAPRAVSKVRFEILWCSDVASVNVDTQSVLRLGALDLRQGEGWQKLAAMPVCTSCHARMDYGMQFYPGFPSVYHGVDFLPPPTGPALKGPVYDRDIDDRVGEAELSPHGFASVAVKNAHFADCMMSDVARYIFHDDATAEDRASLRDAWTRRPTLKSLMRAGLRRFAVRAAEGGHDRPADPSPSGNESDDPQGDDVAIGPLLRADLDAHCASCHRSGPVAMGSPTMPRRTVESMLRDVAYRTMPKTTFGLAEGERRHIVGDLVQALGGDEPTRAAAETFFGGGLRPAPVHTMNAALHIVIQKTAGRTTPIALVETGLSPDRMVYSPSFATATVIEALQACKSKGVRGGDLEQCVQDASKPSRFIIGERR